MKANPSVDDLAPASLHKYFIFAFRMRESYRTVGRKIVAGEPTGGFKEAWLFASLWFGCLYTVIEGWQRLNLKNDRIDELLKSNLVSLLKGFRHDTFHFQKGGFHPERAQSFIDADPSMTWTEDLTNAFEDYFRQYFESLFTQFPQIPRC